MDFDDVADDELMEAVSTLEDSLVDCSTSIGDETSDDELVRAAILAENDDVILSNC
jgi:hypothetical protein